MKTQNINPQNHCDIDYMLRAALQAEASKVEVSPACEEKLFAGIEKLAQAKIKEGKTMKRFSTKMIVSVCAIFCLSCVTALAATGIIGGWVGHNIVGTETFSLAQMQEELLPQLDYTPTVVEEVGDGFVFEQAHLSEFQAMDEENNRFGQTYTSLDVIYANAATGGTLHLGADNTPYVEDEALPNEPEVITKDIDGVSVEYQAMPYKFVPPGYELTPEDEAALADGSMQISYGSAEVEEMVFSGVTWTEDGINYTLFSWDVSLTADEMFAMAGQFINE